MEGSIRPWKMERATPALPAFVTHDLVPGIGAIGQGQNEAVIRC